MNPSLMDIIYLVVHINIALLSSCITSMILLFLPPSYFRKLKKFSCMKFSMHKDDKVASLAPSQTVISRQIDRIQMMKQTNSESFGQISTCRTAVNTVRTNLPPNINSIFCGNGRN